MRECTKSISPLRQRMIEDMAMRKLSPATQRGYVRSVKRFVHFFGRSPDQAEAEDLRRFQLHLAQSGVSSTTINQIISDLGEGAAQRGADSFLATTKMPLPPSSILVVVLAPEMIDCQVTFHPLQAIIVDDDEPTCRYAIIERFENVHV